MTQEKEFYSYTDDGYLDHVNIGLGSTSSSDVPPAYTGNITVTPLRAQYTYDAMGRVTNYIEKDAGDVTRYSRTGITYNNKSQLTHDVVTSWKENGSGHTWVTTTDYDYNADTNANGNYNDSGDLYQGGLLTHSHSTVTEDGYEAYRGWLKKAATEFAALSKIRASGCYSNSSECVPARTKLS